MFTTQAKQEMGKLIKKARREAGLTQAALATKLGYKSPQFVSNFERSESLPPIRVLSRIAKHTGTPYNQFKKVLLRDFKRVLDRAEV
jgi:transcriptional regulator with XRE-family HTH domain